MPRRTCALVRRKAEYSRVSLLLHHPSSACGTGDLSLGNPPSASRVRNGHEDRGHNTHLARDAGDNPVTLPTRVRRRHNTHFERDAGDNPATLSPAAQQIYFCDGSVLDDCCVNYTTYGAPTQIYFCDRSVLDDCYVGQGSCKPLTRTFESPWTLGYGAASPLPAPQGHRGRLA